MTYICSCLKNLHNDWNFALHMRIYYHSIIVGRCFMCDGPVPLTEETFDNFSKCQTLAASDEYDGVYFRDYEDIRGTIIDGMLFDSYSTKIQTYLNSNLYRFSQPCFDYHWTYYHRYSNQELIAYFKTWRQLWQIYQKLSLAYDLEFEINSIDDLKHVTSYLLALWNGAGHEVGGVKYHQALASFTGRQPNDDDDDTPPESKSWLAIARDSFREQLHAVASHSYILETANTAVSKEQKQEIESVTEEKVESRPYFVYSGGTQRRKKAKKTRRCVQKKIRNRKPMKHRGDFVDAVHAFNNDYQEYWDDESDDESLFYVGDESNDLDYYSDDYQQYSDDDYYPEEDPYDLFF